MDKINIVIDILKTQGFNPSIKVSKYNNIEWNEIVWTDEPNNDECYIYPDNISIENNKIAWFQSSQNDNHTLKIIENDVCFTWIPETYNPFFGCLCLLLEWYKNHLIFIYREKHNIYICSIKDTIVNHFNFHGEKIERNDNLISYETYMNKLEDTVKIIQIPELLELEPINKKNAEILNLFPFGAYPLSKIKTTK